MTRRRTWTSGAAVVASLSVIFVPAGVASADDDPYRACTPAITALPLPVGEVSGDVISANAREAVGFVADVAQHQHVAIWRRTSGTSGTRGWSVQDLGDLGLTDSGGLAATGVTPDGVVSIGVNTAVMGGWVYAHGIVHQLKDFAGGTSAYARAINSDGVVAGEALDAAGNDFAARWDHWWSTPVKLGPIAGLDGSYAQGMNDRGQVVGGSFSFGPAPTAATRWSFAGVPAVLASFGADAQASDINNAGRAVGDVNTSGGKRAAVWDRRGHVIDLGVFAGDAFSRAIGVSSDGAVVGFGGDQLPATGHPRAAPALLAWLRSGEELVAVVAPLGGRSVLTRDRRQG